VSSIEIHGPTTSVERAYEALRAMTVEFALKPGERLNEVELARRFEMSRAPVREAMNRLVSEGLLTVVPNQGFSCRRLSAAETAALYEVRGDLEAAAALVIARTASAGEKADLVRFCALVLEKQTALTIEELVDRDEEFHLRLAALAGNSERVRLLQNINAKIRFVRRINLEKPERMAQSLQEHADIVSKLRQGDGHAAADLVRRHLALSAEAAAASIRQGLARIYAESVA
jgi:DNA-binding GntR family transcriptional regulator